jgi:hypothetical protein
MVSQTVLKWVKLKSLKLLQKLFMSTSLYIIYQLKVDNSFHPGVGSYFADLGSTWVIVKEIPQWKLRYLRFRFSLFLPKLEWIIFWHSFSHQTVCRKIVFTELYCEMIWLVNLFLKILFGLRTLLISSVI